MTKADLALMLRGFIGEEPDCGEWEWDDFVSVRAEPSLEPYRLRLLRDVDPYLGDAARTIVVDATLREVIAELESTQ